MSDQSAREAAAVAMEEWLNDWSTPDSGEDAIRALHDAGLKVQFAVEPASDGEKLAIELRSIREDVTDALIDIEDRKADDAAGPLRGVTRALEAVARRYAPSVAAPPREDERRTAIAISVEAALCHEKVHDSGGGDDAPVVWFDACDHSSEPEWPCRAAYGVADALLAGTVRDPERAT